MQESQDTNNCYYEARKLGRLLKSPYDRGWWNDSKYRLCLLRFGPLAPNARVLDIGCGLGQAAYFLSEVAGEVTGVDLSAFAIRFAQENYQRENLHYVQANVFEYEPKIRVDAIFCMDIIEHLDPDDGPKFLQRISGFLKPEGCLYAHVPIARSVAGAKKLERYKLKNPNHGPIIDHAGDPTHKSTFSVPSFTRLLEQSGFVVASDVRKVHCWRPVRSLYRLFLDLPLIPVSWKNEATYSYIVLAKKSTSDNTYK